MIEMRTARPLPGEDNAKWVKLALAFVIVAQVSLVFTRPVNWDESFHFHMVHAFADGRLAPGFQTLFTRVFAPLAELNINAVNGVIVARVIVLCFEIGTIVAVIALASKLFDRTVGLLAGLLYISTVPVFQHGFSFRMDSISACLLMGALAVLLRAPLAWRWMAAFAVLAAMGGAATAKALFYVPALAAVAWYRLHQEGYALSALIRLTAAGLAAAMLYALIMGWHLGFFSSTAAAGDPAAPVATAGGHMFITGLPPNIAMHIRAALQSPVMLAMIVLTPYAIVRAPRAWPEKIVFLALLLPITTLAFYRNTASYYFVFMLAPVAVACASSIHLVTRKVPASAIAVLLLALLAVPFWQENRWLIGRQRAVYETVIALFPEPVSYFDHAGAIAPYPKVNGFLTPYGMEQYREAGVPVYRDRMEVQRVPLLIDNWWLLADMLSGKDTSPFLPEDAEALRTNYIELADPIWVAGKHIAPGAATIDEMFLVPGPYTVRGGPVRIDGRLWAEGTIVEIARGPHDLSNPGTQRVTLVWGHRLTVPDSWPGPGPDWIPL